MKKTTRKPAVKSTKDNALDTILAELLTKALQRVQDKTKMARISDATAATFKAGETIAEAISDCVITPAEVNAVADAIVDAVVKIIAATKVGSRVPRDRSKKPAKKRANKVITRRTK